MTLGRQAILLQILDALELDAILVVSRPNLRFLSGFSGSDGAVIVTRKHTTFLTDSRYTAQARIEVAADSVQQYDSKVEGVVEYLRELPARRVGFEMDALTVRLLQRFEAAAAGAIQWVGIGDELSRLRLIKSAEEIVQLDRVAQLHAEAFAAIEPMLRPGTVETDIAFELEMAFRRLGAEEKAFDYIVASGQRGAMPHGVASQKALAAGELVTLDFGARLNGYHSDETVTVALGEVAPDLRRIFDIVLEAHDRAMAAVEPGVPLKDLDAIARDFITQNGYGEHFGHGLGHGVGLEIHEPPVVSRRGEMVAEENMVFTIEPGIYVEGLGGVRIEDTIVVTETGCRPLTVLPKAFRQFPV